MALNPGSEGGRESVRPPERDELEMLLDNLLAFAQHFLRTQGGEFFPFGATMDPDGQVASVGAYEGDERPESAHLIDVLAQFMRARAAAGQIKAAGICYDSRLHDADGKVTDAISVSLEHRVGDHLQVALPYSKGRFRGIRFGSLIRTQPGDPRIFVDS